MNRLLLLTLAVLAGCQVPGPNPHNVALVYGVGDYDAPGVNNLPFPDQDALGMAEVLNRESGGGFNTTVRINADATSTNIQSDFAAAAATLDANSVFLFYYAGHGNQGPLTGAPELDGHAAIFPYDSFDRSGSTQNVLGGNAITEDTLRDLLATLPTKKVIVILDACFTGGFIGGVGSDGTPSDAGAYYQALWAAFLSGQSPESAAELEQFLRTVSSDETAAQSSWEQAVAHGSGITSSQAQLLTAAGALELSYDGPESFQHGAFTYFLLEAKTKGDYDGNGVVTVSEAYRYTFDNVQRRWNGLWGAVGNGSFAVSGSAMLPHLATGPNDYVLFR